jgi:hypothetical protein
MYGKYGNIKAGRVGSVLVRNEGNALTGLNEKPHGRAVELGSFEIPRQTSSISLSITKRESNLEDFMWQPIFNNADVNMILDQEAE